MTLLEELQQAVIDGRTRDATTLTEDAVNLGLAAGKLFADVLAPAMAEVGRRMQEGEYFIPEVLVSAKAMKASVGVLKPLMVQAGESSSRGKVLIGTAKGDLHDIGKNLVIMMLEGAGFEVMDIGIDAPAERFAEGVEQFQPDIVAMSALLTTTMLQMPKVIDLLKARGLRESVRIMVGGAPLNQAFADEIGADGFGLDATAAVDLANTWIAAG